LLYILGVSNGYKNQKRLSRKEPSVSRVIAIASKDKLPNLYRWLFVRLTRNLIALILAFATIKNNSRVTDRIILRMGFLRPKYKDMDNLDDLYPKTYVLTK